MHVALDIAGDIVRSRTSDAPHSVAPEFLGVVGLPSRIPRESFVWNQPKAARSSRPPTVVSLATSWFALHESDSETFSWRYDSGTEGNRTLTDMIGEALVQNVPTITTCKTVIAVDNLLDEAQQELLLQSLSGAGVSDVELLWRPIAMVLAYLERVPVGRYKDRDKILVIDSESTLPEVTCIELREQGGRLLPLRIIPASKAVSTDSWGAHLLRRRIAQSLAGGRPEVLAQLLAGPFASEFIAFTEGRPCSVFWYRDGAEHHAIDLSSPHSRELRDQVMRDVSIKNIRAAISKQYPVASMVTVLWHGWPLRECVDALHSKCDVVLPADAVTRGAYLYGARLLAGEPAYLDTLPGLYILSEVKELKSFAYFPLVVPGVWEGGRTWRLPVPLRRFSVTKGVEQFPAMLKRSDEQNCRRVITSIPAPTADTPVIIRAEMRPAHGRAKVTIEGAEGQENVFGDQRVVTLDWTKMEETKEPLVSAPSVYPVRGRLFDDEDPECRTVLVGFLDNKAATMHTAVTYRKHTVPFWKLMQPWGFSPPWHAAPGVPKGWKSEPTRGMFGSEYRECDNELLERLVKRIEKTASPGDRVKYLNYMFIYAPESFKQELRDKFSADAPTLDSWNWAIAPGRVFSTRADFSLFAEFMIRIAKWGILAFPDSSYIQHYWWSYFRCLCYHHDTINVSQETILKILAMLHEYVNGEDVNKQVARYCLCAILFSTRLRSRLPDFLQPADELCAALAKDVNARMPKIGYPPAMLATVADPFGEGLNGLVTRFLMQTASAEDLRILEGLTTSMA
jgi:hypothetical protein